MCFNRHNSDHLFISFHGFNELQLGNISTLALKEMQETIWPLWPAGATSEVVNYTAIVRFNDDPWDLAGPYTSTWVRLYLYCTFCNFLLSRAYDIIVRLFRLCSARVNKFY